MKSHGRNNIRRRRPIRLWVFVFDRTRFSFRSSRKTKGPAKVYVNRKWNARKTHVIDGITIATTPLTNRGKNRVRIYTRFEGASRAKSPENLKQRPTVSVAKRTTNNINLKFRSHLRLATPCIFFMDGQIFVTYRT